MGHSSVELKYARMTSKYFCIEANQLITDHEFLLLSEEEKYTTVLTWVRHDPVNRKQHLLELMKNVNLSTMKTSFFMEHVIGEPLLMEDFACTNLLLEATVALTEVAPQSTTPTLGPYIFAIDGRENEAGAISECELYNPRTNKWKSIAPMQIKRQTHAVIFFDRLLYAFGGWNRRQRTLSSVESYDLITDTWTLSSQMPLAKRGHGICSINDSILICGGMTKGHAYLNNVEEYDPKISVYNKHSSMNAKRAYFKVAATGDSIYAVGGRNIQILDTVERFDLREGKWSYAPSMNTSRFEHGIALLDDYIYCTGGKGTEHSGERFNIRGNAWEAIPNMSGERWGHELVAFEGCIYAIGGDTKSLNSVEKFDPVRNEWAEMPSMLSARTWLGALYSEEISKKTEIQHIMDSRTTDSNSEPEAYLQLTLNEVKELVAGLTSSEERYTTVRKWVTHDLGNRKKNFFELMQDVNLHMMDNSFFINEVIRESLLRDVGYTKSLLHAAKYHADANSRTPPKPTNNGRVPYIFVTGGEPQGGAMSNCEVYNPKTNKWQPISPMLTPRSRHAVIAFNQLLYVFGGWDEAQETLSNADYYDPSTDTWTPTTAMPQARRGQGICAIQDSIFICGGITKHQEYTNTVEQFDPNTALYYTSPAMNSDRASFKMAAAGDCIYAIGGKNSEILNTVERFDPREGRWCKAPSMLAKRFFHGVTVLNDYIYCTGGTGQLCSTDKSGERFDIRRNSWETIPHMLNGRQGHELLAVDDCVYAVGGWHLKSVEKFDLAANQWFETSFMRQERCWLGASVLKCFEINQP